MARDLRLSLVVSAQDRATKPLKRIQKNIDRLVRKTGLERVGRRLRDVGRGFATAADNARASATAIGVAAGATVAAFGLMTGNYTRTADRLAKSSAKLDIPVEQLQRLEYAAARTGTAPEQMATSLTYLSRAISEAERMPKGTMATMFNDMGISVRDNEGNMKDMLTIFYEVADAIDAQPDNSNALEAIAKLFGFRSTQLRTMFEGGADGVRLLGDEFERVNATPITEEMAKRAEEYEDRVLDMKTAIGGLRNAVVDQYMPDLTQAMQDWQQWVTENTPAIAAKFREMTDGISDDFSSIVAWIKRNTERLGEWYDRVEEGIPIVGKLSDALGEQTDGWWETQHSVYAGAAAFSLLFKRARAVYKFLLRAKWQTIKLLVTGIGLAAFGVWKGLKAVRRILRGKPYNAGRGQPRGSGQTPAQGTAASQTRATSAPRQTARSAGQAWQFGGGKNAPFGAGSGPKAPSAPQAPRTMQSPKLPSFTRVRTPNTPKQQARMAQQWQAPRGSSVASGPWGAPQAPSGPGNPSPGQTQLPRSSAVRQSSRFQQMNRGMSGTQSGAGGSWAIRATGIGMRVARGATPVGVATIIGEAAYRAFADAGKRHRGSAGPAFNPTFGQMQQTFRPDQMPQVGGKIVIQIDDNRTTVTSVQSDNEQVPIEVSTGYSMPDVMTISP